MRSSNELRREPVGARTKAAGHAPTGRSNLVSGGGRDELTRYRQVTWSGARSLCGDLRSWRRIASISRRDHPEGPKIDLVPMVGANLDVMETDAWRMRGSRPFVFPTWKAERASTKSRTSSWRRVVWRQRVY